MNSPPTPPAAKVTSVAEILRPNSKAIKPSPFSGDTTHSIASIPGPIVNGEPKAASAEIARAAKRSPPINTRGTKEVFRDWVFDHLTNQAIERPPKPARTPKRRAPNRSPVSTPVNNSASLEASNQAILSPDPT